MTGVTQAVFMNQRSFGSGWIATLSGGGADSGYGVAVDSSDNVYVVGLTAATGTLNFQWAKYNVSGTLQWQRYLGGAASDIAYGVAVDSSSNVYVVGSSDTKNIQLAKYNTSGSIQWQRRLSVPTLTAEGKGISVDSSGNVYLVGDSHTNPPGTNNFQIAKYNTSGTIQWQRTLGGAGSGYSYGRGVAVDSSGDVYVVGSTDNPGTTRIELAKYNTSGTIQWQKSLGSGGATGYGVAVDSSGNVYITGVDSASDMQLAKYNTSGVIQWQRKLSGFNSDVGFAIATDTSANVYAVGYSNISGTNRVQIAKYNSSGTLQWQRMLGSASFGCIGQGVAILSNGNVCIVGESNAGGADRFLIASLPNDGSKTGTYSVGGYSYTYETSALTDSASSLTDASTSLTDSASSLTDASTSLTDAASSLTSNTTAI